MSDTILRKYGVATTINFELADDANPEDLEVEATFATGDCVLMKDEGAEANTGSLPTDEGTGYSLALTATEMQMARGMIYIIDQDATKVWMDKAIRIETYGNASAQHAFDLGTAVQSVNATQWASQAIPTPAVTGRPLIDLTHIGGTANDVTSPQLGVNVEGWNNTNLPADVQAGYPTAVVKTGTGSGELSVASGVVAANITQILAVAQAAINLSASTRSMIPLVVNTGNVAATDTQAQFTGHTETTPDHFIGRKLFWYDSTDALFGQGSAITDASWDAVNSELVLTYQQLTESPSDGDLVILV